MDVKQKSFFQTTAGVVTGVAGILTAIVGLLTVSVQLGWVGSKDTNNVNTTGTTTPDSPTSAGGFGSTTTGRSGTTTFGSNTTSGSAAALFTVDPPSVTFESLAPLNQELTITNTGTGPITFLSPTVTGTSPSEFAAADETCGSRLDAGRTCQIKVTFAPKGSGTKTAILLIRPAGGTNREVPLKGTALL